MLDALQVGVAATLGLVPDREGTSRGLVDDIGRLTTRHLAQLAHLFRDGLAELVHLAFGFLTQGVGPLPRLLEDALDTFTESVQRRRLGGTGLTLVDGDAAVQLPKLSHGCCEAALRLRGASKRVVEPPLLVCHVPVDLLRVVSAPVDVEDRRGQLLLCNCLVLVHVPSTLPCADATEPPPGRRGSSPAKQPREQRPLRLLDADLHTGQTEADDRTTSGEPRENKGVSQ